MKLGDHLVENFGVPYVIAEIGANHNGDVALARKLIDEAKAAGCHSAKFQSWTKDSIFSRQVYEENYFLADDYRNRKDYNLEEIVDAFSTSEEELAVLKAYCDQVGITFSCTPFSRREVDFLVHDLNMPFIKVASMDCVNYPFLDYIARKKLPTILSTGLCTLAEVDRAVQVFEQAGNRDLALLHCIAQYPPKVENTNLRNIDMLRDAYPDYPVGFSDHSIGVSIPLAAVARGACILEKHFTLDKDMFGWDHKVSTTPDEMKVMVEESAKVAAAMGSYRRVVTPEDMHTRTGYRRSIVAARAIPAGKTIERDDLDFKRPGTGIAPEMVDMVVGRVAKRDIAFDRVIDGEDF